MALIRVNTVSRSLKKFNIKYFKTTFHVTVLALPGYKKVQVREPGASGFCGRATGIYPSLARLASKGFGKCFFEIK